MIDFTVLDWILLLVLLGYFLGGLARGFFMTLGAVVGFAAGAVAAFYVTPFLVERVSGGWKIAVAVASILVLICIGQALGIAFGRPLRRLTERTGLGPLDRIGGAILNLVTCAFVIVALSFSASQFGVPSISTTVGDSTIISTLQRLTPQPVQRGIAQARAAVLQQSGIPRLEQQIFPEQAAPTETGPQSDGLKTASASVVKINGSADACSQNQSGSGFVASGDHVVTNAHVVAGVVHPVIQSRNGQTIQATVVAYNPEKDLAVLYAPDLEAQPLDLGQNGTAGEKATIMGYDLGGPFMSRPASIQGLQYTTTKTQNGTTNEPREMYQLAANVQEGNSGGPLLNEQGQVIGVIFAKATQGETGYALSMTELHSTLDAATSLTNPVGTGQCTVG
ncbi:MULTISPECIES: MarP family serine protease [Kocuria]|uniref:MarP family serine protease n=1 Tax=Kocuria TaxID=57493 RepID=UPI000660A694|nr:MULTISPECIES: MarP family serine protease [Kocuria]MCT1367941.1 MarP family serine protease [Rothia sp. p3-SID1597]RUQ23284.1 serine protease [Kocuria sp. HSID16901]